MQPVYSNPMTLRLRGRHQVYPKKCKKMLNSTGIDLILNSQRIEIAPTRCHKCTEGLRRQHGYPTSVRRKRPRTVPKQSVLLRREQVVFHYPGGLRQRSLCLPTTRRNRPQTFPACCATSSGRATGPLIWTVLQSQNDVQTMIGINHRSMASRHSNAMNPATTSSTMIPSPPGKYSSNQLMGQGLSTSKSRNNVKAIRTP